MYVVAQCGEKFPKVRDPVSFIQKKNWNVRIVQKEGSQLSSEGLFIVHRKATDAIVKAWTKDIENGNFIIEKISQTEVNQTTSSLEDADTSNGHQKSSNHNSSAHLPKKRLIIHSDDDSEKSDGSAPDEIARRPKDLAREGSGSGVSSNRYKKHQPDATITTNVHNVTTNTTKQRSDSFTSLTENPDVDEDEELPSGV